MSSSLSPSILMYPESALSIPPRIFNRVDFPEPEGPSNTQNSPFATEKFIPRKTSCLVSPLPNPFFKSTISKNFFSSIAIISSFLQTRMHFCPWLVAPNFKVSIAYLFLFTTKKTSIDIFYQQTPSYHAILLFARIFFTF